MWDNTYNTEDYVYGTEANSFLQLQLTTIPPGRVLCLGDGEGRNSVYLAEQGYQVTAVDASLVGINKAKRLAAARGVTVDYIHQDLAQYQMGENCWSAVVSIFCHLPPTLRAAVHQQVVAALQPGGVMVLEGYTPRQIPLGTGGPKMPELLLEPLQVSAELKDLQLLSCQELQRPVLEGSKHTGVGAVLQLLARKPAMAL